MGGTIHPYYTVALAPAVAALIGLGGTWAWRRRAEWDGRIALGAIVALAAAPSAALLHRGGYGGLWPWVIVAIAVVAVVALLLPRPYLTAAGATIGLLAGLASTATVSVLTAATPHHGAIPTATQADATGNWTAAESRNTELAAMLAAAQTPWSAATNGSQSAAELEISSGTSVMAIGGWSSDPVPDLAQFIDDVHAGRVSYYVESGKGMTHGEVIREPATPPHTPARSLIGSPRTIQVGQSAGRWSTA